MPLPIKIAIMERNGSRKDKKQIFFFIKKEILRGLVKKQVILQGLIIIKQIFLLGCSGKGSVGQRYMVG